MKSPSALVAITASLCVFAATTLPSAQAKEKNTITEKEYNKIRADYLAAKKDAENKAPKNKTTKVNEDLYDYALREVNKRRDELERVNNDPKSTKDQKNIAKMNLESAEMTARANKPEKGKGDHIYRDALKKLRIRDYLYEEARKKKIIYPPDPRFTKAETGDSTGIFKGFSGRNSAKIATNNARVASVTATRPKIHCKF